MSTTEASPDARAHIVRLQAYQAQLHTRFIQLSAMWRPTDPPLQFCQELMGFIDQTMPLLIQLTALIESFETTHDPIQFTGPDPTPFRGKKR